MDLNKELKIVNIGLDRFTEAFRKSGADYVNVDFRPPSVSGKLAGKLKKLSSSEKVKEANHEAFGRIDKAQPVLIDVLAAKEAIKDFSSHTLFHAAPPVKWENMCGPMKGAAMGACVYEGWAGNVDEAEKMLEKGKIKFSPCHHSGAVGPMAGILSPSMYVWAVENETYGNTAFCSLNEGLGKVLRFGAYGNEVISHLKWMENILGPALQKALRSSDAKINVASITSRAIQRGDECHNRNEAATSMLLNELIPLLIRTTEEKNTLLEIIDFIKGNPHFYLNLSMAACKASTDPISGLKNSTLVSAMARNGTEIGLRVAGCGQRWFTAPAGMPEGLFFSGFSQKDANPDIGDSTVSEVAGIGGFAMAAAPAIVKFVGGTPDDALNLTGEMSHITHGPSSKFQIPAMNFAGTPTGIDILKVLNTGIAPFINTGIAHKKPGIGQVGAGMLRAPIECFKQALEFMEIN